MDALSPDIGLDAGSPWHEGEIALQKSAGVVERMAVTGRRSIRDHLIEQHRTFYPQLPFIVAGTVDRDGDAWATILAGHPGFLSSPDEHTLTVARGRDPADPADAGLDDGAAVGLLGIELDTRRRNRLNGTIRARQTDGFDVAVAESFGNCPQYIQLRDFTFVREPSVATATPALSLDALDDRARAMIATADTLYIASYVERADGGLQVDVSHRGGRPGFVDIGDDGVLTIPDFAGNLFFNTLGNILTNPKSGMVFVDFTTGDLLHLSGDAEVVLDAPEIAAFQGAERLLRFRPRRIVYRADALPIRGAARSDGASPNAGLTGTWDEARKRLAAAALAQTWRPYTVARIVEESTTIRSLILEPADGLGVPAHVAGQHLPIRVSLEDGQAPAIRTYTLSAAPSDGFFRISVRRGGRVSDHIHRLAVGDRIEARAPAGAFTIDAAQRRPAVLLAAGIGVTPMLAMLRHIVYEGLRTRRTRPTTLFYAARSKAERAFDAEIAALAAKGQGAVRIIRLLTDTSDAEPGRDYETSGRLTVDDLRAYLSFDDYDFYMCGPSAFTQDLYDGLRALDVADGRIHAEAFGPSGLTRDAPTEGEAAVARPAVATDSVEVVFAASGKTATWSPASGSLLDLAESVGIDAPFGCRSGSCGTCRVRVAKGAVAYAKPPSASVDAGEALLCCGAPAAGGDPLELAV